MSSSYILAFFAILPFLHFYSINSIAYWNIWYQYCVSSCLFSRADFILFPSNRAGCLPWFWTSSSNLDFSLSSCIIHVKTLHIGFCHDSKSQWLFFGFQVWASVLLAIVLLHHLAFLFLPVSPLSENVQFVFKCSNI